MVSRGAEAVQIERAAIHDHHQRIGQAVGESHIPSPDKPCGPGLVRVIGYWRVLLRASPISIVSAIEGKTLPAAIDFWVAFRGPAGRRAGGRRIQHHARLCGVGDGQAGGGVCSHCIP